MSSSSKPDSTPSGVARDRLLASVLGYVLEHGTSDLSLRELARGIGTSHRMLLYHFGSKEGLMMAIVGATEAAQRDFLAELAAQDDVSPADAVLAMWEQLTDSRLAPHERLFYELYGQALQARPGTEGLFPDVVDSWLVPGTAYWMTLGLSAHDARAETRLGLAVVRGLLLDLLATNDKAGADAAIARYAEYVQWRTSDVS